MAPAAAPDGPRVVVVGLGPAGPDLVTAAGLNAVARIPHRFLRTTRHPAAAAVAGAVSFDTVYEQAATLDDVYPAIAAQLAAAARDHGEVVYAVPGSPLVAERTVELLRADATIAVEIIPALSFLDLAWLRLGVDPLAAGVRLVDGHRFAADAAGERGPLLVAQCDTTFVLSDIKLAVDDPGDITVTVLQRLGLPDESVVDVAWADLDRDVEPDHLTCIYIPTLAAPVGAELVAFHELVRTLRAGCPWDREQTHTSLTPYLLEEAYEVLDAIHSGDPDHLEEELGDLLFQVYFHAVIAEEAGDFNLADVARGIHDKLYSRHPHVFGAVDATTAGEVVHNWEAAKKIEKGRASVMEGIPNSLPALAYARKVQGKAARVGFDWDDAAGVHPKVDEELAELRAAATPEDQAEELGDLLFAVVNLARHLGIDSEDALRRATAKFRRRFEAVEALAAARGVELSTLDLAGLDALWDDVKATE